MKVLVGNFFDYGQYALLDKDNERTKKPYGPFAKIFDECDLSNIVNMTIKTYEPFPNIDPSTGANIAELRETFWVGSGNFDDGCFPGNILIWLIDLDRTLNLNYLNAMLYQQQTV